MGRPSKYTPEFREEAVRLHREQGASVAESARRLGLGPETLRKSGCARPRSTRVSVPARRVRSTRRSSG